MHGVMMVFAGATCIKLLYLSLMFRYPKLIELLDILSLLLLSPNKNL